MSGQRMTQQAKRMSAGLNKNANSPVRTQKAKRRHNLLDLVI